MRFSLLLLLLSLLLTLTTASGAQERVALVVGNMNYAHAPRLANPLNDAQDVGAALGRLGFTVTTLENADYAALRQGLLAFTAAAARAQVAVVFYAGHGIEVDQHNYLIPVDARLAHDRQVAFETVPLAWVSDAVAGASEFSLVILDACRENPFAASMRRSGAARAIGRGLAKVEPAKETLVAYAAKAGTLASDGSGRNSPYTTALLRYLEEPGLEVGLMFRKVRDAVLAATGRVQEPFTYGSLSSDGVYLTARAEPPPKVRPPWPQGTPGVAEAALELSRAERRQIQLGLLRAGYDPGDVDGLIGDQTRAALKQWQASHGEAVTGYLNAEIAKTLLAAGKAYQTQDEARPEVVAEAEQPTHEGEAEARAGPEAEVRLKWEKLGLVMVYVEGGGFTMGCQSKSKRDGICVPQETPAHEVQVRNFEIGKYEVTQALWEAVMGENPSWFDGCDACPVGRVSWHDVQTFIRKLNGRTGKQYRLPTEAEWEYAARGGRQSQGYRYAGSDNPRSVAWQESDASGRKVHPVGQKQANELGLHDMSGNVKEWVRDCWIANYNKAPSNGRSSERGDCGRRVVRGGAYHFSPRVLRAAWRDGNSAKERYNLVGFRLARTLTQ